MKPTTQMKLPLTLGMVLFLVLGASLLAQRQPGGDPAAGDPNARGGPGNPKGKGGSPDLRMLASLQQRLEVADDEWKVLAPRISTVLVLSRQLKDLRESKKSLEPPKAPKPPKGDAPPAEPKAAEPPTVAMLSLARAAADLRAAFEDRNASGAEIKVRLAKFREARAQVDRQVSADLGKAREELRELLTPRQELTLIMVGLLD